MRKILTFTLALALTACYAYAAPQASQQRTQKPRAEREDNDEGPLKMTKGPRIEFLGWDSAVIAWGTSDDVNTGETRLKWGTSPNDLDNVAQTENAGKDFWHRAHLRGLQPDTTYYYQIDDSKKGPLGRVGEIHTKTKAAAAKGNNSYQHKR